MRSPIPNRLASEGDVQLNRIVSGLGSEVPFVPPDVIERAAGKPFRLRMGANESPFGPSPKAVAAMAVAAATGNYYNDPDAFELRVAIAGLHRVRPENVVVGAGIDDLLLLLCRALLDPEDLAVMSFGGYPTFAYSVRGVGAGFATTPYRDDRNDLSALSELARDSKAEVVYLSDPDNPSGTHFGPEEIEAFQRSLPPERLLILDQAYADFTSDEPHFEIENSGVVRLRTFSKAHGMAGLRVGYALAAEELASALNRIRLHFSVNRVALAGALASLNDTAFLADVVRRTAEARRDLAWIGERAGLRAIPSSTNFVTFDTGSRERAEGVLAALQERGVFIRKPGRPPLDSCIRVTVGLPEDQAVFEELLGECLSVVG